MKRRNRLAKKIKSLFRPVSVIIIPHNSLPSIRFSFSIFTLLFAVLLWTSFTLWSGYVSGRRADYYVTKADNAYLKAKVRYMSAKVEKGLDYLSMARRTETQLKKMLGIIPGDYKDAVGGPTLKDIKDFRKALLEKREVDFKKLGETVKKLNAESSKRLSNFSEISWYITNKYHFSRAIPVSWPVKGRLTSGFGYRVSPISLYREFHSGVDIANRPGTPVYSTADGVVRRAGWISGYGLAVLIDHGFGYSTLYAHNSEILVKEGQKIKRGQMISRIGSTGTSTGPHLHYEVWQNGIPKNPMSYIRMDNKACKDASIFESIFSHKIQGEL